MKVESFINEVEKKKEIDKEYPNLSNEERCIISSYTCESSYDTQYSPYRILNSNMVADDRKKGLSNLSKYLYILLITIRKLKKYEIKLNRGK